MAGPIWPCTASRICPLICPSGLRLAGTTRREDVRDVLRSIVTAGTHPARRGFKRHLKLKDLPPGATIATSSTRRKMSLLSQRPDW